MEIRDGERYEALLNRGMADEWCPGTAQGGRLLLDEAAPGGETVAGDADVAVLRPIGDADAYFRWFVTDTRTGKRRRTRHVIRASEDMAGNDDTLGMPFVPDLGSREVRYAIGSAGDLGGKP